MNTDNKADKNTLIDRGETLGRMEPMKLSEGCRSRGELTDLVLELTAKASALKYSLPAGTQEALASLVRSMNCYYSNLIEGHDTHPIDIERALSKGFSANPEQRNLQHEARAHITVQKWIDEVGLQGAPTNVTNICKIHKRFVLLLPQDLRVVINPDTKHEANVLPGKYREEDVCVGQHIAISPGAIDRFMCRYEEAYSNLGKTETILATAAAHHRLLWIHPFLDGNGRVARLVSHATLLKTLDHKGLWSVARGFARSVNEYKAHLAKCDYERRNDLDGRGTLSEEALAEFTQYFLKTCLDQVVFMTNLMAPEGLRGRITEWARSEVTRKALPARSEMVLEALLYRGELARGEVASLLDYTPRHARRVMSELSKIGVITSDGPRVPWRLVFPAKLASRWMPGLFPEKAG